MESDVINIANALLNKIPKFGSTYKYEPLYDKLPEYYGWAVPKYDIDWEPEVGLIIDWDEAKFRLTHVINCDSYYKIYVHNNILENEKYVRHFLEDNF